MSRPLLPLMVTLPQFGIAQSLPNARQGSHRMGWASIQIQSQGESIRSSVCRLCPSRRPLPERRPRRELLRARNDMQEAPLFQTSPPKICPNNVYIIGPRGAPAMNKLLKSWRFLRWAAFLIALGIDGYGFYLAQA